MHITNIILEVCSGSKSVAYIAKKEYKYSTSNWKYAVAPNFYPHRREKRSDKKKPAD